AVFYRQAITTDDYLRDPIIAEPISRLDCDMPVDGAGAMVIASAERALDCRRRPAYIAGYGNTGFDFEHQIVYSYERCMEQAEWVAKVLWENTGLTAADIDCASMYDGFSHFVPMLMEGFGLCARGEALDFIGAGAATLEGVLPLNTSGGSLGMGRLHGI